jgi:cob(I)alamin adenosyltransferase
VFHADNSRPLTTRAPSARQARAPGPFVTLLTLRRLRNDYTSGLMKIYTKTGDAGSTGLFGGGRVQKDDVRVEAYGDVDELNAVLGMARSVEMMPRIDEVLLLVQRDLFAIGALLATPDREKMAQHLDKARIDEGRIAELERSIDDAESELEPLRAFILPGGTPKAAALHVARTVCRRAERHVVRLQHDVELPPLAVIYLNRLSDLLFTLARLANRRAGAGEVTW